MSEGRIRPVPAVSRAIAILRLLGRVRAPLGVKAIARELDLVPSTALHILRALVADGLVRVDATKRYGLGTGMLSLARAVLETSGFANLAQPELDRLSTDHAVTAIGVETLGVEHMVVLALSRARTPIRLHVDVGSRFPALISATGRCVAAFGGRPLAELKPRFDALRWQSAPPWKAWCAEVETVRRQGYAIDRGNYIAGITIVAVPVLDSRDRITHTLVCIGLTGQLTRSPLAALARDMRETASGLSANLVSAARP
jgi:DNA-binding IclR family transcriptional regulator